MFISTETSILYYPYGLCFIKTYQLHFLSISTDHDNAFFKLKLFMQKKNRIVFHNNEIKIFKKLLSNAYEKKITSIPRHSNIIML